MAFARLWALATMVFICRRGDRSLDIVIPRSTQKFTTGNVLPSILNWRELSSKTLLPTLSTQHLLGETLNCHSLSQSSKALNADCSLDKSHASVTCKYSFRSSANSFAVMPCLLSAAMRRLIKEINIIGPMALPCTMPLMRTDNSDTESPTLV